MKTFWSRSYIKIQDILAELDGLVTVFVIIIALSIHPYIKNKYFEELINEVFDVKVYRYKEKEKKEINSPTKVVRKQRPAKGQPYKKVASMKSDKDDPEDLTKSLQPLRQEDPNASPRDQTLNISQERRSR